MSKKWKIILASGAGVGILAFLYVWFVYLGGGVDFEPDKCNAENAELEVLSGHYVSSKKDGKHNLNFTVDGPKEANGQFKDFTAELTIDGSLEGAQLKVVIDVGSIDTDNSTRDSHLKEEDFFHVSEYPKIVFESSEIVEDGDNYKAVGTLTFLGKEWDFEFPFKFRGVCDEDGVETASFEGSFSFRHFSYGIEKGGGVGEVAELKFYVEMIEGGEVDDSSSEDNMEDDFEDDWEEETVEMPTREYDELLDKVEEEAKP